MKICNSCQAIVEDANNFCTKCGGKEFSAVPQEEFVADEGMAKAPGRKTNIRLIVGIAAAAVVVVAAVIIAAVVLLNPVKQLMRSIESGDFDKANQIYEDKVSDDRDSRKDAYKQVLNYAEELLEQYTNQEIGYEDLAAKLDGIDSIGILEEDIYEIYGEADYLHNCRDTFAEAEAAFAEENYREALELYQMVAGADFENGENAASRYDESVELYRQKAVEEARDYIEAGEFYLAYSMVDSALEILPYDSELQAVYEECMQAEHNHDMLMVVEEARVYTSNGDYPGALAFLDSAIESYPDETMLQQERSQCLKDFEAYVIEESLRLAREGEYQHALSLAESGLGYFTSTQVSELAMIYKSYIPVILGEMEMFQNNTKGGSWASKTDETNKYLEDNYSNTYANSLSVGCGSVTYLVNFKYQTFTGTVAFPKGLESDGYRSSATLQILGDDQKIAEFAGINESSKPETFELDISSYERITLKWTCEGDNIWEDWGYFATIFDGIMTPIPMELPE